MDITNEEFIQVVAQLVKGEGRPVSEDEATLAIKWADHCRIEATLLEIVLKGEVFLKIVNGEIAFVLNPPDAPAEIIKDVESYLRKRSKRGD